MIDIVLIIILVLLILTVIFLAVFLFSRKSQDYTQSFTLLQQRINQIEEGVKSSLDAGNKAVGEKYESSLKIIGDIKQTIGSLEQTNKQMLDIGKDIASLQDLLRPPQIRGSLGELTLGHLLDDLLPKSNFQEQYRFKNGSIVDAVIKLGDRLLAVDSKFPLESFQRYTGCPDGEKKAHLREFERAVRNKIDDISAKYILEDESTYDFALMYIPSENIYYQTILKGDTGGDGKSISDYALDKRVVIVSPNSIYAYLRVICVGLRSMQFENNMRKVMDDFNRLGKEFEKFEEQFRKLGSHLTHAQDTFSKADRQLETLTGKLSLIGESPEVKVADEHEENLS